VTRALRVLHLEDDPRDAETVQHRLHRAGIVCDITVANNKAAFEAGLRGETLDVVIADYTVPGYDGVTALKRSLEVQPDVPVILLSGTVGEEEAVRCLHIGATDYLLKERLDRLGPAVQRAIREANARRRRREAEDALVERERALSENEKRTSFALAAARMGVWDVDLATNRLSWSDTMAPLFGLSTTAVPTTLEAALQLVHPDDRADVAMRMEHGVSNHRDWVMEFRAVWADGSTHWLQGHARASYDAEGVPLRLLGIAMDIDQRKALEEQLHQALKLEAIGRLAGGIAHDFNNVLTVILGFGALLSTNLSLDDTAQAHLFAVKKAASHAEGLTRQLLAFSRKQRLQPLVLDMNTLIGGLEPMLRQLIAAHIELIVSLTADAALIRMDPTQLEQVLVNLALNAADAMPRGGKLTIRTTNESLAEQFERRQVPAIPGTFMLLTVTDTGQGMDEATRRHIFEPFFSTKAVGKGTGLGLASVYGIVKQSGGDIAIETAAGQGTTFRIYLPQVTDAVAAKTAPADDVAQSSRGTETVLLVEDDSAVRQLARVTLERSGYQVLEASNPREAAQVAGAFIGPIHLLLSDVIMPESEGPPLLGRLATTRPSILALYISGYADDAVREVLSIEGRPFLQKPFTPQALAQKVRGVLDDGAKAAFGRSHAL
jgi:two-component system cell cycle sensor histidine kinase/response regulator CckA